MVEAVRCRAPVALVALIFYVLASVTDSVTERVSVPGSALFFSSAPCSATIANSTRQEFIDQFAAQLAGIDAQHISIKSVTCTTDLEVKWQIMLPPGAGPSNEGIVVVLRGFRDDDHARETLFKGLKAAGFVADKVDFSMAMWKCTETMDCTSLTGYTGNHVHLTLGVNATELTTTPPPTPIPEKVCPMADLWLMTDLRDVVPCDAQIGIFFGGIAFVCICCPLTCWICRQRERRLLAHLCEFMDPEHLATGSEAFRIYWWTALASTAEDLKGIPTPDPEEKVTPEQATLLIKEREAQMEDEGENEPLMALLVDLYEKGYITKVDPSLPVHEMAEDNLDNGVARATTLYERAVTQKGAQAWNNSLIATYGRPHYKDGQELEFYSIRNVCWLIGTIRVFAADIKARGLRKNLTKDDAEADAGKTEGDLRLEIAEEKQIMYGIELQLGDEQNGQPLQWRYRIGMDQLRSPLTHNEDVEVCHTDGSWITATVVGPRMTYRVDVGHGNWRQQLGYSLKATKTGQIMNLIPAERVRRLYTVGAEVEFYESRQSGWMPATLTELNVPDGASDIEPVSPTSPTVRGNDGRDSALQPWATVASLRREAKNRKPTIKLENNLQQEPTRSNAQCSWSNAMSKTKTIVDAPSNNNRLMTSMPTGATNWEVGQGESSRVNIWTHMQIKLDHDQHPDSLGISEPTFRLRVRAGSGRRANWI